MLITNTDPETIIRALNNAMNNLKELFALWMSAGSGWVLVEVMNAYLDFARYVPIRGGSYMPLPPKLKAKHAIINIKNRDHACLRWALRAAFFPTRNPHSDRPSQGFPFQHLYMKYRKSRS